jgi:hypothetical protein
VSETLSCSLTMTNAMHVTSTNSTGSTEPAMATDALLVVY